MGQMEMKCIFNIGKKNSILAKANQVSYVAHGPLVVFFKDCPFSLLHKTNKGSTE
jgi:hypothetical protein